MYTLFLKDFSNMPFEVRPMPKNVQCFHMAESIPQKTVKGFVEFIKNGETKIVNSSTNDEPETTHFETFWNMENISATIWGFKSFENSDKKIVLFSDLPKFLIYELLPGLLAELPDKKREELL